MSKFTQLLLTLMVCFHLSVFCQDTALFNNPLLFIEKQPDKPYVSNKRVVRFLLTKNKSVIARYNPVSLGFGGMMFVYQQFLSPQFASDCPYDNSCSNFSKLAIQRFGLFKGIALSADRLTRCNEFVNYDITLANFNKMNKLIDSLSFYTFRK